MTKPPWDTARAGLAPSMTGLDKATPAELERANLAGGIARVMLNADEKLLADNEGAVRTHSVNLAAFQADTTLPEDERAYHVDFHRRALAEARYRVGKVEQALDLITLDGTARPTYETLYTHIKAVEEALSRPDDDRCACEREQVTIETGLRAQPEVMVELPRRVAMERIYSPAHGQMVTLWACSRCNDLNAHDNTPEYQVRIEQARQGESKPDHQMLVKVDG